MWRTRAMLPASAVFFLSMGWASQPVQFPDNFRRWVHVGTGVILPGSAIPESEHGMHHIFANEKAVEGYTSGEFPDGAVLVYELRSAQQQDGVISEGERRRVDVMIKDSKGYQSTGGWRFERFMGDQKLEDSVHDAGASCFACHGKAGKQGAVFSRLR